MTTLPPKPIREEPVGQLTLFDKEPHWKEFWWDMPSYELHDARPAYRIMMNFLTEMDLLEFISTIGAIRLNLRSNSAWFPERELFSSASFEYANHYDHDDDHGLGEFTDDAEEDTIDGSAAGQTDPDATVSDLHPEQREVRDQLHGQTPPRDETGRLF